MFRVERGMRVKIKDRVETKSYKAYHRRKQNEDTEFTLSENNVGKIEGTTKRVDSTHKVYDIFYVEGIPVIPEMVETVLDYEEEFDEFMMRRIIEGPWSR